LLAVLLLSVLYFTYAVYLVYFPMLSGVFTTGAAAAAVAAALLLPPGSWQPRKTNGIKLSSIKGAGNESSLMLQLFEHREA
jgi:hypothetical protein